MSFTSVLERVMDAEMEMELLTKVLISCDDTFFQSVYTAGTGTVFGKSSESVQ